MTAMPEARTWRVERHGGRATDRRRLIFAGAEKEARAVYDRAVLALRQGEVRLIAPDDAVVRRATAPRLRTRW
ncbi:hypothetical protein [Elioraea sp.]|uniref:hypothetical protein n=1 Tax=Elioraea sp. TaxID=2185103 RepID=UPI0021DBCD28|nr:hypothetical protein [Elioraea sp.]GIX10360.1 MAG: hypothetical protein KatS3mg116_2070 [Elioraea sp.]